jgi:predicted NACHT family NTPase
MAVSRKLILEDWQKANDALNLRFAGNKSELSKSRKISRTLLTDFFAQKPIGESSFRKICLALVLNWEEIAQIVSRPDNDAGKSIEDLVQKTRIQHQPTIKRQCGTIFLLGARKSVEIGRLFVRVNILERLTGEQRWGMERLLGYFNENSDAFNRFGLSNPVEIISGDDAAQEFDRLMVLGKPGAGKTTFLKHVAIACMFDGLLSEFIPVFLSLKKFADDLQENAELTLLDALQESFSGCDLSLDNLKDLLKAGRMIVLLDGLDEAGDSQETVDKLVRRFMDEFHQNRFVIGCRIAAYSRYFEGFTDVEVADFDRQQVHEFVEKWFAAVVRTRDLMQASKEWADKFMTGLDANPQIWDLMVTPLLLNLACVVFRDNERFPTQPYELYEESLTTLMSGWDSEREVKRDSRYKALQTGQRLRLLSQVGAVTFVEEAYFFKQERVEELIEGFLRSLPDEHALKSPLVGRDEGILKAIESHHGLLVERARRIYSFSHLTFQEYFTARHLIASREGLEELVSHAIDPRWQQVLLLAVALLKDGYFLIRSVKRSIDQIIAGDADLQLFLEWVKQQSNCYRNCSTPSE